MDKARSWESGEMIWAATHEGYYKQSGNEEGLMEFPTSGEVDKGKGNKWIWLHTNWYSDTSLTDGKSYRYGPNDFPLWSGYFTVFAIKKTEIVK